MPDSPFAEPKLHLYQRQVVHNVLEALHEAERVVLQMPTASGKTFTAIEIVRKLRNRGPVWFVCHRQEIIRQTVSAFNAHNMDCGVIAPWADPCIDCAVQVASMQSLKSRLDQYPAPATIVWDECHHAVARTWAALFDRFSGAWHIGLTATPERLDGKPLSSLFRRMVCGPSTRSLIDQGYLSPFKIFTQRSEDRDAALMALSASKGDYRVEDLSRVMNTPIIIGDAVEHYNRHTPGKRALAFTSSVEASKALVDRFLAQGTPAVHVDASTHDEARKAAVEALREGRVKVISNVDVFTEGTDVPALDAVILLRPTRSLALYLQMVGRVLRKSDGKKTSTILDHAGFFWQHPGPADEYEWSLDGGARENRLRQIVSSGEKPLICPRCGYTHKNSFDCAECGFEYSSSDLPIEAFQASLINANLVVPIGYETSGTFARRYGKTTAWIGYLKRRGLDVNGGIINIAIGVDFVERNINIRSGAIHGNSYIPDFCKKYNLPTHSVRYAVHNKGMPCNPDGSLNESVALSWLNENTNFGTNSMSIAEFSRMVFKSEFIVRKLISKGMPVNKGGAVIIDDAMKWIAVNLENSEQEKAAGWEAISEWRSRNKIASSTVSRWLKKGIIPGVIGKFIDSRVADEWLDRPPVRPRFLANRNIRLGDTDRMKVSHFAKRYGIKTSSIQGFKNRGMPHFEDGTIDVRNALIWIRTNSTVIVID